MAEIGACVSEHDSELNGSFCHTMLGRPSTLENRARRQVAAVWANVCAGGLEVTSRDGHPVSLAASTAVQVAGYSGTVESWLTMAQGELLRQRGAGDRKSARESFKRVIRVAWHLNRGIGIGPVCAPRSDDAVAGSTLTVGSEDEEFASDPEPLEAELMDESQSKLAFGAIEPNPIRDRMAMAYSIATEEASDVTIGVYDVSGRLVRELVRASQAPGTYVARWDGRDANGTPVRGGMYFVSGRIGQERAQSRVTLVR